MKIGVIGAAGKMGQEIIKLLKEDNSFEIVHLFDEKDGFEKIGKCELKSDILIDFSYHSAINDILGAAKKYNQKLIVGTTGFTVEEEQAIVDTSREIAILQAPNMSIGVNLIFEVLDFLSKKLDDNYDFDLLEIHHNQKKDAPSGTAKKMLKIVNENKELAVEGHSMRIGDIFGEHLAIFTGNDEKIEIKHTALNRAIFVKGALLAAKFIIKQDKGLFSMKDVLGI